MKITPIHEFNTASANLRRMLHNKVITEQEYYDGLKKLLGLLPEPKHNRERKEEQTVTEANQCK